MAPPEYCGGAMFEKQNKNNEFTTPTLNSLSINQQKDITAILITDQLDQLFNEKKTWKKSK